MTHSVFIVQNLSLIVQGLTRASILDNVKTCSTRCEMVRPIELLDLQMLTQLCSHRHWPHPFVLFS